MKTISCFEIRRRAPRADTRLVSRLAAAVTLSLCCLADASAEQSLTVHFSSCSEFVGLVPIDAVKAQQQLPPRYALVLDSANTARLVVRMTDCQLIQVGSLPGRPGRLAQVGLLIASPDGTAADPNTGINNYTISYASNVPPLVAGLLAEGVPAALDLAMEYEVTPPLGTASSLYAAVAPEIGNSPRIFLDGSVNTPTFGTTFLANWWRVNGNRQTRMQTDFPTITFDFASSVAFTTGRTNIIGDLLPANRVTSFAITYRGLYDAATMTVSVKR